ncbi:MAG: helix-turn-helix domain-containing protein [Propionibacterium sp.]|nr:helix-turn-helix domain-containing protein [Propionibacterium sp.]
MDEWSNTLRERLSFLVETVPPPAPAQSWTNELIASEVRRRGIEVTTNHISHLRAGRRGNPSARLLGAIAETFGVPVDYFFDQARADRIQEQLSSLSVLRDAQVQGVAGRGRLEDAALVADVIRALQRLQQGDGGSSDGAAKHEDEP